MYREAGGHRLDRGRLQQEPQRQRQQQQPGHRFPEGTEQGSECPRETADKRDPRDASGYVLVPANETRRNEIQRIARKELENLERWKQEHRPGPINLTPMRLGGAETEASARQKQQDNLKLSKYQQKFKRDDYRRKIKEEEEAEILKMKAIQREKADRLEAKRQQQEMQRKKRFEEDKHVKNNDFLSRLESGSVSRRFCQKGSDRQESTSSARSFAYHQTQEEGVERNVQQVTDAQHRKSDLPEGKQRQEEEERKKYLQREHRRVNNAFLDRLQGTNQ